MASVLLKYGDCCAPCAEPLVFNTPGIQGDDGEPGTNGANGSSSYTTLTGAFTMPAEDGSAVADVGDSTWIATGQVVFLEGAGYFEVTGKPDNNSVTLKNLGYIGNAPPGTIIPILSQLSPSGRQGPNAVTDINDLLTVKQSVRATTTANITLAGLQTIDTVVLVAGDRVLVKDQTVASENGIYIVVDPGAWTRATDADTDAEVTEGMFAWVTEGLVGAGTGWVLTTDDPIVLGTTNLVFAQFAGTSGSLAAGNGIVVAAGLIHAVQSAAYTIGQFVYASGAATLGLKALAIGDIPSLSTLYLPLGGGTLTGLLTLSGAPTNPLHAATKAYVDAAVSGGVGTVTSVGISGPSIITWTSTPVTTAGTFSGTLANQTANIVLAGPATGAAATPTFRALVVADIPDLSTVYLPLGGGTLTGALTLSGAPTLPNHAATKAYVDLVPLGTVTSVALTMPTGFTVTGSPVTTSGTLAVTLASHAANLVLASPSGGAGVPVFRLLVAADIPSLSGSYLPLTGGTLTGGVNVQKNGSDTELLGPYYQLSTVSGTAFGSILQLGAAGTTDIWNFNAATGLWKKSIQIDLFGHTTITTSDTASNWKNLRLASSAGTSPGLQFLSDNANAAVRNWGIATDRVAFGDFNFLESAAKGGDPMDPGTALIRFRIASGGAVFIPGTLAVTGALTAASSTLTGAITALQAVLGQAALTYAATVNLDFNAAAFQTLSLTGNVTFTTSNLAAGKSVTVEILCDGTPRTFTFPAGWIFMGTAPTGIAAGKTGMLTVKASSTTDASCKVAYAVEA